MREGNKGIGYEGNKGIGQIQKEMQKREGGTCLADQGCEHRMFPVQEQRGMV